MFNYNDPYFNENQIQPSILDITNQGSMQFPQTNQVYPNSFFDPDVFTGSNNPPLQQFSKGGQVKSWAEYLRRQGREGDDMLVHINPGEAAILKALGGSGTRNPHTGLPEFKSKFWRTVGKAAAPLIGTFLGGPAGAIGLGALQGFSERGKGNKFKGALGGAGRGALFAALAPMAGEAIGLSPTSFVGKGLGMDSASLLSQLGLKGAPSAGGGLGLFGNGAGNTGIISKYLEGGMPEVLGSGGGAANNILNNGNKQQSSNGSNWLDNALLATAILGTLGRKEKMPKEESLSDFLAKNKMPERPEDKARKIKPMHRKYFAPPPEYRPGIDPEWQYFEDANPQVEYYAKGGMVEDEEYFGETPGSKYLGEGYLHGEDGGQDDTVPAKLSHGEFIFSAPAISILGGGNSNAGGRIASRIHESVLKHGKKGYLPKGKSFADILANEIKKEFR